MASRFRQALLNDPETAEQIVEAEAAAKAKGKTARAYAPEIRDWDTSAILLTRLTASVERQTSVLAGVHKARYKPQPPLNPVTEVDRVRERRRHREVNRLFNMFTTNPEGA
ncbi:hypothetical protein [Brevibacterium sp.]|uniref:hypothetical protein n=1 Tax=Brevibacterium sp. TaxID=1701 RepID=UPI0028118CE6|nr:hypothetical protein [Brevibacterium sp.]